MKIIVKENTTYDFEIPIPNSSTNQVIKTYGYNKVSEWEGLVKYSNGRDHIIVNSQPDPIGLLRSLHEKDEYSIYTEVLIISNGLQIMIDKLIKSNPEPQEYKEPETNPEPQEYKEPETKNEFSIKETNERAG